MKRWEVLADLIRRHDLKTGAEIGVKSGRNIAETLQRCPWFEWYAVDPWELTPDYAGRAGWTQPQIDWHEKEFNAVARKWLRNVNKVKAYSVAAATMFPDLSFDLVFIDGDHSYEGVRADIDAWLPKVRGIIAGHDYDNTLKYGDAFKGVDRAVDETFGGRVNLGDDHVWWAWA